MIRILETNLSRIGVVKNVDSAARFEGINGENTLDFKAILDAKLGGDIDEDNILELNDDYFDIAYFKKIANEDNTYTLEVEGEHVSYRLNQGAYNVEYFTYTGTPTFILGKILEGTHFTVGTVEYTAQTTYSAQEAKSRRQILMEFVALIGGEAYFDKFEIGIVEHRGSENVKIAIQGRNIKVMSKIVSKREQNMIGYPVVSYACTPVYLPEAAYELGDDILLVHKKLSIQSQLRVISLSFNPYDAMDTSLEFSNYRNGLADSLYYIETGALSVNKLYYGARISPENGFESIRNDKMARAVFNADTFAMQVGDGGGSYEDVLYFDPIAGTFMFKGLITSDALNAAVINALTIEVETLLSQTIITNNLYANKGYISELTVDSLDTSTKAQKYLNSDTSNVDFIRIHEQTLEFIGAVASLDTTQATDRNGAPLYWLDETHKGSTTTITDFPVTIYVYEEFVKLKWFYELDSTTGNVVPKLVWGIGIMDGDKGKGFIEKDGTGLLLRYVKENGDTVSLRLGENGIEFSENSENSATYLEYNGNIEWNAGGMDMYFEHGEYSDKPTYVGVYPSSVITPIMNGANYAGVHLAPEGGSSGDLYNFTALCTGLAPMVL